MTYKEASQKASEIDKSLTLKNFHDRIYIEHCDGSKMEFNYAMYKKLSKEFMVVFTEHHGYFVFHVEDVKKIEKIERTNIYYNEETV